MVAFTMSLEYVGVNEKIPCLPWVTWSTMLANVLGVPFAIGETVPVYIALGTVHFL